MTRLRFSLFVALAALSFGAPPAHAQRSLSPPAQAFVEVDDDVVALVGVRVIDGTGGPAQEGRTVLLRGNRIDAVGPAASVSVPAGARVLDLAGHTVLPGYVMLHEHLFYPTGTGGDTYNNMEFSFPKLYLAGGVTTIRTTGGRDPYGDLNLREDIDAGRVVGPRIDVTGPYLTGPGYRARFLHHLKNAEEARAMVRYWADAGVTSFKAYQHITRSELAAAIEEAHARGIKVTGHICSVTFREAAEMGIDNLEHGFRPTTDFVDGKQPDQCPSGAMRAQSRRPEVGPDDPDFQTLVKLLVDRGVAITSTLVGSEMSIPGRPSLPQSTLDVMASPIRDYYLRNLAAFQQNKSTTNLDNLKREMAREKVFVDAGGLLVTGTDPGTQYGHVVPGYSNVRQVEMLHEAGFTPEQAVRIATLNGAIYLGRDEDLGTVAQGKLADLIVVEGDPRPDMSVLRNPRLVFKDGIGYDPVRLYKAVQGVVGLH